jgi:eukaryotic-like serine/threonine-protein kinase
MTLEPGTRLGPFEIVSVLGAGGMGEVYKARDTRLDRTVAIKVLPEHADADSERRARFEREAKTIAGLNHPNICTLHDVGEHQGSMFLVMEHVTGETLADRLREGSLPPDQALVIATDIADALAAAHRQGIVHRDLKPGNVMLTKGRGAGGGALRAKLLDFGLAKLRGQGPSGGVLQSSVTTAAAPATEKGTILGTLPYMAPEQMEGKEADARSDI